MSDITFNPSDVKKLEEVNSIETEKINALIAEADNTFKGLCETLQIEQIKLMELEDRRKKLHAEIKILQKEIDEEKKNYQMILPLGLLGDDDTSPSSSPPTDYSTCPSIERYKSNSHGQYSRLETCYEVDEDIEQLHALNFQKRTITLKKENSRLDIHAQIDNVIEKFLEK